MAGKEPSHSKTLGYSCSPAAALGSGGSVCSINPTPADPTAGRATCPLLRGDIHPTGAVPGVASHGFPPCSDLLALGCHISPGMGGNPTPKGAKEVTSPRSPSLHPSGAICLQFPRNFHGHSLGLLSPGRC